MQPFSLFFFFFLFSAGYKIKYVIQYHHYNFVKILYSLLNKKGNQKLTLSTANLYLIVCLFLIYHVPCECCCCKAHVLTACKRCLLIERELKVRARQLWAGDINESVTVEGCR